MASGQKDKCKDHRNNFFSHFPRLDSLLCYSDPCSYDLTKERTNDSLKVATKKIISKLFSGSKPTKQPLTYEERHLFALYNEGLLLSKHVHIRDRKSRKSDEFAKSSTILTTFDHPILNICLGFTDRELRENCRIRKQGAVTSYHYSETCPIRAGIDRVLSSPHEADFESKVGGVPVSLWLDMYNPVIQLMLMLNLRRGRRSSLTKRRKHQLFLQPNQPAPVMGDVLQDHFHAMGPPPGWQYRNIMAVVSYRFGELGERSRFRTHIRVNDAVVQTMRQPNLNRSRTTQAYPMNVTAAVDPIERHTIQDNDMFPNVYIQ